MKKVIFGTDHAGYELKEILKDFLIKKGVETEDVGCFSDESCDYPDFIRPAAEKVADSNGTAMGIVLGGSGQGEAIVANKVKGIRAGIINSENMDLVELTRTHNNANVLSFGSRFVSSEFAKEALWLWLNTNFEEGRHLRRINKIE